MLKMASRSGFAIWLAESTLSSKNALHSSIFVVLSCMTQHSKAEIELRFFVQKKCTTDPYRRCHKPGHSKKPDFRSILHKHCVTQLVLLKSSQNPAKNDGSCTVSALLTPILSKIDLWQKNLKFWTLMHILAPDLIDFRQYWPRYSSVKVRDK